jgi:hypothetical protein
MDAFAFSHVENMSLLILDDHGDGLKLVSELLPPTDLLLVLKVIYEHGKPWWNDIDRGKLLIRPPEFCGSTTSSHLVASRRNGLRK